MNTASSTLFTAAPGWHWLIAAYFFVGGLAGGAYFLAVLIDLFGSRADRRLARLGYYVALPSIVLSAVLLTLDLRRPERFWHMLIQSETWRPMWKPWSPMSAGSWALLAFGVFALVSAVGALAESGRLSWPRLSALRPPHPLGAAIGVVGGLLGFYVAGYTGVLLSVTNRPIWADTPLLGLLFIVSAASVAAAALALLGRAGGADGSGLEALDRFDSWALGLQLIVLIALIASLGGIARLWLNLWGVLLVVGVVLLGMLAPIALRRRARPPGGVRSAVAALLVLAGAFVLRIVIVFSSEAA